MNWQVVFEQRQFENLKQHLLRGRDADEEAAFLVAGVSRTDQRTALLVRDIITVPNESMFAKGKAGITISPEFIAPLVKRCRNERLALIQAHSHPFNDRNVYFSAIDDAGEARLFPKIRARAPSSPLAAIVFGQRSCQARVWQENRPSVAATIYVVGEKISEFDHSENSAVASGKKFSRQVGVIGSAAQSKLRAWRIGIVGLGGTGSHVLQQLAYLGAENLLLVDPDIIEESNLSRLIGSTETAIGEPKVRALETYGRTINSNAEIACISGNVFDFSTASKLRDCHIVFGCTDNLLSRMVLTRFSCQYLIPLIDMGINVQSHSGILDRIGGRVTVQRPGDPCLDCLGILDSGQLTKELAQATGESHHYYTDEENEFAPAVVSLNGVVASLAVTELLRLISQNWPTDQSRVYRIFDGLKGVVRTVQMMKVRNCGVCEDVRGMGDLVDLPVRLDC